MTHPFQQFDNFRVHTILDPELLKTLTDTTRVYSVVGQNFKSARQSWGNAKPAILSLSFRQLEKVRIDIKEAQTQLIELADRIEPNERLADKEEEEIQALVGLVGDVLKEEGKTGST